MAKTKGLILTTPGAPLEPHIVFSGFSPIPGYYAPHIASPVGGDGEVSLEHAKAYAADPSVAVALVDIPNLAECREYWRIMRELGRTKFIAEAAQSPVQAERDRAADELAAAEAPDITEEV